jgi:hypothetical protein
MYVVYIVDHIHHLLNESKMLNLLIIVTGGSNNFQHGKYDKPSEGGSVNRFYDTFPTLMNDICEFLSRLSFISY